MLLILGIILLGFIWTFSYTKKRAIIIKIAYSIFWGSVLFVLLSVCIEHFEAMNVWLISSILVIGMVFLQYKTHNYLLVQKKSEFSLKELISIFSILTIYTLIYSKNSILDTINHYFFAEQIGQ